MQCASVRSGAPPPRGMAMCRSALTLLVEAGRVVPRSLRRVSGLRLVPFQDCCRRSRGTGTPNGDSRTRTCSTSSPNTLVDVVEQVLAFVPLDGAKEAAAGDVRARRLLERRTPPNVDRPARPCASPRTGAIRSRIRGRPCASRGSRRSKEPRQNRMKAGHEPHSRPQGLRREPPREDVCPQRSWLPGKYGGFHVCCGARWEGRIPAPRPDWFQGSDDRWGSPWRIRAGLPPPTSTSPSV